MNYSDFERVEPADLPDFVSPLYFELIRQIDARGGTDNARIIKFCIAYTTYCVRKKDKISEAIADGHSSNHGSVRKSFTNFQSSWVINSLIDEAKDTLADTIKELREASIDPILTEVKNSITAAKTDLAGDIARHSTVLETKIDAHSPQPRRGWWAVLQFFLDGIKHAGHLIIAVAFIILVVGAIDHIWPTLLRSVLHVVEDVIGILRQ